jgi:flavin reductase (DIM6/NTAB) family NADH-FMN oxidoreductase RutF
MTMRQWTTGVTIVTTALGDQHAGMTVSSFTSVTLEPPTVLVCLHKNTYTHQMVQESGVYAISLLASDQESLSNRFAGFEPNVNDRFEGVALHHAETGSPLLSGALAWLDCRTTQTLETITHTIFVAEVVYAQVNSDAAPLVYHNRGYKLLVETTKIEV